MNLGKEGLSIIIPCYNGEGNVRALFDRIKSSLPNEKFQAIFVNDGSLDRTEEEIKKLLIEFGDLVVLVSKIKNEGIAKAWLSGLSIARMELVCFLDADLQNPPEYIPIMRQSLVDQNFDVVQGTRSDLGRIRDHRFVMSRALNFLLNWFFKQDAKDSKSGFVLGYKRVLEDSVKHRETYRYFQTFLGVAIRSKSYSVGEVETLFDQRKSGSSFLSGFNSIGATFGTLLDFPKALREYSRRSFREIPGVENLPRYSVSLPMHRRLLFELYFLLFPLHTWLISRKVKSYYKILKATEFSSRSQLNEIQILRLRNLLVHAYRTVPYYRELFKLNSINPLKFSKLEDLHQIPMLSKDDVRKNIHFGLFSRGHKKREMQRIQTSGSTGEPFVCYADKFQLEMRFATTLRALEMVGWQFGDKQTRLWHQKLGMTRGMAIKEKFDAVLLRRKFVPAFEMTVESVEKLISSLNRRKPKLIDGYAESLNFLAVLDSGKIKFSPLGVMSSAQELTEQTRQAIETKFGCKVFDKYGSREFSGIAYECREGSYHHVQDESYIVEILVEGRQAKVGEIGEVVITDLNNFSTPLIRYRIGDLAEVVPQDSCPCGRSHTMIGKIYGRTQALIYCTNGVWLPGTFFAHFFKDYNHAVRHFQIVQHDTDGFRILIVPNTMYSEKIEREIRHGLEGFCGASTKIDFVLVDEIPLVKTGKRTPVVSSIRVDFQKIESSSIRPR